MAIQRSTLVDTADIESVERPPAKISTGSTFDSRKKDSQANLETDPLIELLDEKIGSLGVLLVTNISKCFWPIIAVILVFKL